MNIETNKKILGQGKTKRILVVGDVMLDEYVWGKVGRISPEAPVPVVEVIRESFCLGGAANVARNLHPFCAGVEICGIVGNDATAERLIGLLASEGVSSQALVRSPLAPTIVKTRIVARQQQIVRIDREKRGLVDDDCRAAVLAQVEASLPAVDAVILQDYAKGLFTQELVNAILAKAAEAKKIVTADPNPANLFSWDGAHLLKPNRSEAFAIAGLPDPGPAPHPLDDKPLLTAAQTLLERQKIAALLLTLSEHGMLLIERDKSPLHIPARAQEVYDVSGAGDTAIALLTLALSAGASLPDAANLANLAASIVVGKLGTATILPEELCQ